MEKILSALHALGVEQYVITERHTESLETFYVKKALDLTRRADTAVTSVRVFRPFEKDGTKMLGEAEATVRPGMSGAEADYEKCFAMQSPPRLTDGLYSLEQMHEQKKDWAAAIRDYERILEVNESDYDDTVAETDRIREKIARLQKLAGEG